MGNGKTQRGAPPSRRPRERCCDGASLLLWHSRSPGDLPANLRCVCVNYHELLNCRVMINTARLLLATDYSYRRRGGGEGCAETSVPLR